MMTVWPALWPPAYRATMEKFSERTSTILPLPSSPHWAPTMTAVLPRFTFTHSSPAVRFHGVLIVFLVYRTGNIRLPMDFIMGSEKLPGPRKNKVKPESMKHGGNGGQKSEGPEEFKNR